MATIKNFVKAAGLGVALTLAGQAQAAPINVGGVIWDPDQTFAFPALTDLAANGSLIETASTGVGSTVYGWGKIDAFNSSVNNESSFCPGCELTFSFSMDTLSITPTGLTSADFEFNNLVINMYVDHTPDFNGTQASAEDFDHIFLTLVGNGNLTGSGDNIGTGSDDGDGSALLDVIGGIAMGNFDTNTRLNGADLVFSSSFQPIVGGNGLPTGMLFGTIDISGNTIPEPSSLALLGLGLLGLGRKALKRKA